MKERKRKKGGLKIEYIQQQKKKKRKLDTSCENVNFCCTFFLLYAFLRVNRFIGIRLILTVLKYFDYFWGRLVHYSALQQKI